MPGAVLKLMSSAPIDVAFDPEALASWCRWVAAAITGAGDELHLVGHLFGNDRVEGLTRRGNGDDRVVALAVLAQIGGELATAAQSEVDAGRVYASQALVRQLIEVEYLMWAFAEDGEVARQWFNADRKALLREFSPDAIRRQADGAFDVSEFQWHCNHGGHPTPTAPTLLAHHGNALPVEAARADLGMHVQRVWDRLIAAWHHLLADGAIVLGPPALAEALAGKIRHACSCEPRSEPGLASFSIDADSGRLSIHLAQRADF